MKGLIFLELRQLQYFQMVSKFKNFTRAAEILHISQPSITTAIRKLEEELGIKLFDRNQKQVSLTTEGKVFLTRIDDVLRSLDDAVTEMKDYKQLNKGKIRLGIPPMIGAYVFPNIFLNFKQKYPNISLSIVEEGSLLTKQMVEEGSLDLGIIIFREVSHLLEAYTFSKSEILVCVSSNHSLSGKREVSFADLSEENFIMLKEGFYHRQLLLDHFQKHSFNPNVILASNQLETIKSLVANGIGISFLLEDVIKGEGGIVGIPLNNHLYVSIGLVWKKGRYLSNAAQAFIDFISKIN